jgi:hypothetical protein
VVCVICDEEDISSARNGIQSFFNVTSSNAIQQLLVLVHLSTLKYVYVKRVIALIVTCIQEESV